jgi:hypothetical protein
MSKFFIIDPKRLGNHQNSTALTTQNNVQYFKPQSKIKNIQINTKKNSKLHSFLPNFSIQKTLKTNY